MMVFRVSYTLGIWAGVGLREHGMIRVPYDGGTVLEQMRSD